MKVLVVVFAFVLGMAPVCAAPGDAQKRRLALTAGARYSNPQDLSAAFGLMAWRGENQEGKAPSGWLVEVEPGTAGGRLSAGYAASVGWDMGELFPMSSMVFTWSPRLTYLRTWGDPIFDQVKPDQSYLGAEGQISFSLDENDDPIGCLMISYGYLRRVSGDDPSADNQLTPGVGYRF